MTRYEKGIFRFAENNIKVTIPFERLGNVENTPVDEENTPVTTPVSEEITPVEAGKGSVEARILEFCCKPKGIREIVEFLGYKEKKTVRKYLNPLLEQGRITMTISEKPNSRLQNILPLSKRPCYEIETSEIDSDPFGKWQNWNIDLPEMFLSPPAD